MGLFLYLILYHINYMIYYIIFFEEDVDNKYMSIYKEDKNKKDGFEHLISLQTVG